MINRASESENVKFTFKHFVDVKIWVKFICVMLRWPISFGRLKEKLISWNAYEQQKYTQLTRVALIHCLRSTAHSHSQQIIVLQCEYASAGETEWNVQWWTKNRTQIKHSAHTRLYDVAGEVKKEIENKTSGFAVYVHVIARCLNSCLMHFHDFLNNFPHLSVALSTN